MTMLDMRPVIVPKSDQMNGDDLLAGPMTIRIREVAIRATPEQPVSIFFDGDNGKPWKPCKSMAKVLVYAWGPDAKLYAGKSLTLYRDPEVKWGGLKVGGIRISHMSDIGFSGTTPRDTAFTVALSETRGVKKPFTVQPLKAPLAPTTAQPSPTTPDHTPETWAAAFEDDIAVIPDDMPWADAERRLAGWARDPLFTAFKVLDNKRAGEIGAKARKRVNELKALEGAF